jgi:cytidine deaminase
VTENGGPPCGVCRQVLYEFGPSMTVIVADPHGQVLGQYTLDELLPHGFGPLMLEK